MRTAIVFVFLGHLLSGANYGDLRNLSDDHTKSRFGALPYRSLAEWTVRRVKLQRQILVSAGLWPMPRRTELISRRFDRIQGDSYVVEKVALQTLPGFYLAGNLYLPKNPNGKTAGVLVPHGHWKHGRVHQSEEYSVPALCISLARQGYVAFAYDMVGYNDTRQLKHDFGDSAEEESWSFGPMGLQLWNSIRSLDFLESLPEVDGERLAITGASGGGTQTILLAAIDERVKAAAPVDMVSASFQGDDACEMAPGLRVGTNNVEIAALTAPRPMLLVSSTKDWTKETPLKEFQTLEAIYRLYGQPRQVANFHLNAKHNYNRQSREAVYRFFDQHLGKVRRPPSELVEREPVSVRAEDLLLGASAPCSDCLLRSDKEIFDLWRAYVLRTTRSMPLATLRELMQATVGADWPERVAVMPAGERILLERENSGERIPARWVSGAENSVVVAVHEDGSDRAIAMGMAKPFEQQRWGVLYLDVFQRGAASAERSPQRKDHLTFHRSDDADRVQDILTGLAYAAAGTPQTIRLQCQGRARLWCLAAAALSPEPVVLSSSEELEQDMDRDPAKALLIPGFRRAGGLEALRRLAVEPRDKRRFLLTE
jgi:hypothetical protein